MKKYTNIVWSGIDYKDYPDFVDAYIDSADLNDEPCTDEELDELNDDYDLKYELLMNHLF